MLHLCNAYESGRDVLREDGVINIGGVKLQVRGEQDPPTMNPEYRVVMFEPAVLLLAAGCRPPDGF